MIVDRNPAAHIVVLDRMAGDMDLANERRRFGYRRLFILLRREGEPFVA